MPARLVDGMLVHPCEFAGCQKWGSVGYGVHLRLYLDQGARPEDQRLLGVWFCSAHARLYEEKDRQGCEDRRKRLSGTCGPEQGDLLS